MRSIDLTFSRNVMPFSSAFEFLWRIRWPPQSIRRFCKSSGKDFKFERMNAEKNKCLLQDAMHVIIVIYLKWWGGWNHKTRCLVIELSRNPEAITSTLMSWVARRHCRICRDIVQIGDALTISNPQLGSSIWSVVGFSRINLQLRLSQIRNKHDDRSFNPEKFIARPRSPSCTLHLTVIC
jgi:hypothetical protein